MKCSNAMFPAQLVLTWCERFMIKVDKAKDRERERLIEKRMSGVFRSKTREKAIAALNNSSDFGEWNLGLQLIYSGIHGQIEELMLLAKTAVRFDQNSVIAVSAEDHKILHNWNVIEPKTEHEPKFG